MAMSTLQKLALIFFMVCFNYIHIDAASAPNLEKYNVDPNDITVSGISSGGVMAIQAHFILSNVFKGSGIFAAGPFACAYGNPLDVVTCTMNAENINVDTLIERTDRLAERGDIDPTNNLNSSKIYIFHGINDATVKQVSSKKLETMVEHYGANILTKFDSECNHGQPVDGNGWGGPCEKINKNYINECGYNGAYEMFNWLYGQSEKNLIRPEKGFVADGKIVHFDQNEFVSYNLLQPKWMGDSGLLYVPKNCQDGATQCRLHVAFHGCASNEQVFGTDYVTKTQYAEVAEVNNIIVLFPQTANVPIVNTKGCWDWVGLTGLTTFATKSGLQISAVNKMIQRILTG